MLLAADNINAMNPVIEQAMQKLDPQPVRELAQKLERNGAQLIDINPGYLSRNKHDRIEFLVDAVQDATRARLILDSPHPEILARGLKACREKPVISALTKEEKKLKELLPLAVEADTELVLLLLDEHSICPRFAEEKLALALELWQHATSAGMAHEKLIFDPVLPSLSWNDAWEHVAHSIQAVRMFSGSDIFGRPARTMAGISNLLSGISRDNTEGIEETCLAMLAGAGLSMALVNLARPEIVRACDLINRMSLKQG